MDTDDQEHHVVDVDMRFSGVSYRQSMLVAKLTPALEVARDRLLKDGGCDRGNLRVPDYAHQNEHVNVRRFGCLTFENMWVRRDEYF